MYKKTYIFQSKYKSQHSNSVGDEAPNAEATTLKTTSQLLGSDGDSTHFSSNLISLDMKISASEVLHNVKVLLL